MVDQETLEKLEAGFQKLQDAKDCKSLLKKHLTREVFDKLKNETTGMGATLLDVIQSGKFFFLLLFIFTKKNFEKKKKSMKKNPIEKNNLNKIKKYWIADFARYKCKEK